MLTRTVDLPQPGRAKTIPPRHGRQLIQTAEPLGFRHPRSLRLILDYND